MKHFLMMLVATVVSTIPVAKALKITGTQKNATSTSAPVRIETFTSKGRDFNQNVQFKADGSFMLDIPAQERALYWINSVPYYLSPDDEITLTLPEKTQFSFGTAELVLNGKNNAINTLITTLLKNWKNFKKVHPMTEPGISALIEAQLKENSTLILHTSKDVRLQKLAGYFNSAEAVQAKVSFLKNQKYDFKAEEGFYKILTKLDLNDPTINQFNNLMLSNFVDAFQALTFYKNGNVEPSAYEKARFLLENVNNPRIINESISRFILLDLNAHGLSPELMAILPVAKEKITNNAMLLEIENKEQEFKSISLNAAAPVFTLRSSDGKDYTLASFKGKVVVIDVWATWCSACIKNLPHFSSLSKAYQSNPNVVFLTISIDEPGLENNWRKFLKDHEMPELNLSTIWNKKDEFQQAYQITGIPRYIVINKEGHIIASHAPEPADPKFRKLIEEALQK